MNVRKPAAKKRWLAATLATLFALLPTSSHPALAAVDAGQADLDKEIEQVLHDWKVPGASVAVIKDNDVVLCRGYGVIKQGSDEKVNEQTLFAIGSCTKAFTSTAIGIMKDEDKLGWDDQVTRFIPTLALYDPYVTNHITIRDLLSMRSGLQTADGTTALSFFDSQEVVKRLKFFKPAAPFRYKFTYVNAMFLLAGEVLTRTAGSSWQDFVTTRIISPLHMTRTNTSIKQLAALGNVASPHHMAKAEDQPLPVPYYDCDVIAPAGSINSCAADLVNWLKLQMGNGKYGGKQLISESALNETHTPQTIVSAGIILSPFPEADIRNTAYCLGWGAYSYRQHREVTHTGGIDGMRASLTMLPDDHIGIAVLTNTDYGDAAPQEIIKNYVTDHFLHLPKVDWNQKLRSVQTANEAKESKEEARIAHEHVSGTKPSHPLKDYVGTFESDLYGQLKVELRDDKLVFSWPRGTATTEHWHFDTFKLTYGNKVLGTSFATFNQLVDGTIDSVEFSEFGAFKRRQS